MERPEEVSTIADVINIILTLIKTSEVHSAELIASKLETINEILRKNPNLVNTPFLIDDYLDKIGRKGVLQKGLSMLPLHFLVMAENNFEFQTLRKIIIIFLTERSLIKANINALGQVNNTVLHFAAFILNMPLIALLLAQGASCDLPDADGNLPLHLAALSVERNKLYTMENFPVGIFNLLLLHSENSHLARNKADKTALSLIKDSCLSDEKIAIGDITVENYTLKDMVIDMLNSGNAFLGCIKIINNDAEMRLSFVVNQRLKAYVFNFMLNAYDGVIPKIEDNKSYVSFKINSPLQNQEILGFTVNYREFKVKYTIPTYPEELDPKLQTLFTEAKNGNHNTVNALLTENKELIYAQDLNGKSVLHFAASCLTDNEKIIRLILSLGGNGIVNQKDNAGNIPLFYAIGTQNYKNINTILDNTDILTHENKKGINCLHLLAKYDMSIPEILNIFTKINIRNSKLLHNTNIYHQTALFSAVFAQQKSSVETLINYGADVLVIDSIGQTVLHKIATVFKHALSLNPRMHENIHKFITFYSIFSDMASLIVLSCQNIHLLLDNAGKSAIDLLPTGLATKRKLCGKISLFNSRSEYACVTENSRIVRNFIADKDASDSININIDDDLTSALATGKACIFSSCGYGEPIHIALPKACEKLAEDHARRVIEDKECYPKETYTLANGGGIRVFADLADLCAVTSAVDSKTPRS